MFGGDDSSNAIGKNTSTSRRMLRAASAVGERARPRRSTTRKPSNRLPGVCPCQRSSKKRKYGQRRKNNNNVNNARLAWVPNSGAKRMQNNKPSKTAQTMMVRSISNAAARVPKSPSSTATPTPSGVSMVRRAALSVIIPQGRSFRPRAPWRRRRSRRSRRRDVIRPQQAK